jgi:hypothetical protein
MQKSVAFLSTNNEHTEKEIGKIILFIRASKQYLVINITKETKSFTSYSENSKTLKKVK